MALNLADGQLAASSSTLLVAGGSVGRTVNVILHNTSAQDQTVQITVERPDSTARTVDYATLAQHETRRVNGLPLDPADILAGSASGASAVDYLVQEGAGPAAAITMDATGVEKVSQAVTVTIPASTDLSAGEVAISGLLEECRDLLMKIG